MMPLTKAEKKRAADGSLWELWERDGELTLLRDGLPTDSSRKCDSVCTMVRSALSPIARAAKPVILLCGLGLGRVALATQQILHRAKARFIVAEPEEQVMDWCRRYCQAASGLWADSRIEFRQESAVAICGRNPGTLNAILLCCIHSRCEMSPQDAATFFQALKEGCMLAILLARADDRLQGILRRTGFDLSCTAVPVSAGGKQTRRHILLLARRGRYVPFAERRYHVL